MKTEIKIKHLEFIQGVINRLANNSFLIKGWTITVFLAGLGFFLNQKQPLALVVIAFVIVIFWFLDSFYLKQEKLYRRLYSDVVKKEQTKPFDMDVSKYNTEISSSLLIMFSYPLYILYLPLIVVIVLIYKNICLN